MPKDTEQFLTILGDTFMDGDVAQLAEHYVYPLAFYMGDDLQVFGSAATFAEALTLYRDALTHAGVAKIAPRVVAEGLPVRGFSNVWVEWDYLDTEGCWLSSSQVHYVFNRPATTQFAKIELIEQTSSAFPFIDTSFARTANG